MSKRPVSAKYDPLCDHLASLRLRSVVLDFSEIERIIGASLPASARTYSEWWANETSDGTTHVQCRAWLRAGYESSVNLGAETVTFRRTGES
jgi:hypothetical protein